MDDMALLRDYAANNSETAFEELVSRRVSFVYSAALRQVRDPQLAGEITQAVFIILAQKAGRISEKTILTGWFFRTTRFAALAQIRAEVKRRRRELEVKMQSEFQSPAADEIWNQMSPLLDEALATLGEKDRQAVLLRFFENKSLAQVGNVLGAGEDTARKRVSRALEKLRRYFAKRGVTSTTATIAEKIATNFIQAAPTALAKSVTAVAIAKGAAASGSTLTLVKGALKAMAWAKAKAAVVVSVGVLLAAGMMAAVVSGPSQDREASRILKQMYQRYALLSSYSSTGKTVEEIDNEIETASFTMRLGRPSYYLVEYEQHNPTYTNKGTLWSDGSGDYFADDLADKAPQARLNKDIILKSPTSGPADHLGGGYEYMTGGASIIIPAMFFDTKITAVTEDRAWCRLVQPARWARARLVKEPDEKVGETDCHVLSAETGDGEALLWIGKDDLLVHRSQQRVRSSISESDVPIMIIFTQTFEDISVNQIFSPSDFRR